MHDKPGMWEKFKNSFTALTHRDFALFMSGQLISLIGTWMQRTAQVWLVYTLTKSPFLLGLLGAAQFLPMLLFSLFFGVLVDRIPKKKLLLITNSVAMIQSFVLFILVFTNNIQYWHVLLLAFILGTSNALELPSRQSYFIEMVGKKHLMNAISLNSTVFNITRIIGPAFGGLCMAAWGASICFFLNFISFIAVLISLIFIKAQGNPVEKKNIKIIEQIKTGLLYIKNSSLHTSVFLMMLGICTFAFNNEIIIPVFTKTILHLGQKEYSFLLSAQGFGSLLGALYMATRSHKGPNFKFLIYMALSSSFFLISSCFSKNFYLTMFLVTFVGFSNLVFLTTANSTLQLNTEHEFRGRVMSVYALVNAGTTPIGNIIVGGVNQSYGAEYGFLFEGIAALIVSVLVLTLRKEKIIEHIKTTKEMSF